ncbi:hypothetical protein [Limnobacter sp.]|uniref:hypothetical protein n=1 Tax=Limnobacter sp. TaxID=2003368 RepID=UPI002736A8B9|nr:hypothetical protein [Limnobacter sp.]MDP3272026.1 hypothetical protein [Limnobacter sp.]
MQKSFETLEYEETAITLTARFDSEVISLQDAAAFFTFLSESFGISLEHSFPPVQLGQGRPSVTTNVSVEAGSIKALVEVLRGREYQVGVAASLTASVIWAAATFVWPANVQVDTNVPRQETVYRVPIDPQLTAMVASLNATGKPWSLELSAKDPRYSQELKITIKGNQRGR